MSDQDRCVLEFCNEIREKLGRQPVEHLRKGTPRAPHGCVVANTINYGCRNRVACDHGQVDLDDEVITFNMPVCVQDLITAFDNDELPKYMGEGWIS